MKLNVYIFLLPTICGKFIVETRPEQYGDEPRSLEIKSYATTFTSFQSRTIYSAILELKTGPTKFIIILISGAFSSFGAPNLAQKNHPWSASLGDVDLKNSFTIKKALSPRLKGV